MTDTRPGWLKTAQPFLVGGAAGCIATSCIQPIDMIKVRIQLAGEIPGASKNPIAIASKLIKEEGFAKLYKGLDAGLLRQITYTTTRLGVFRGLSDYMKPTDGKPLSFAKKAAISLSAGAIGAIVGNPADLALIRLQADSTLPAAERRNYTGVADALTRITKEEGVLGLWKGATPTVVRAMALNLGMLAPYDQAKETFEKSFGKGMTTNMLASAVAGFFAVTFSLPFDLVKTRVQKQKPDANGVLPYKNMVDAAVKIFKKEGPLGFYAGYPTYYVRIAPHAMMTLLASDYLNDAIKAAYHKK